MTANQKPKDYINLACAVSNSLVSSTVRVERLREEHHGKITHSFEDRAFFRESLAKWLYPGQTEVGEVFKNV